MSKVKIKGNASGTGVLTIEAPNTNTDSTITLPDGTGELIQADASGDVGIGTDAPTSKLSLSGAGTQRIDISNTTLSDTGEMVSLQWDTNADFTIQGRDSTAGFKANWYRIEASSTDGLADNHIWYTGTSAERMRIDSDGAVTMPNQPAFNVKNASQNNIAVDTEVTIHYNSETFDNNSDYSTGAYTFTAPVTGKYQLNVSTYFNSIDTSAGFYQLRLKTSNRDYLAIVDPNFTSDLSYWSQNISVLADMDAGDTAYVVIYQSVGSVQTDIQNVGYFSGYLVC